MGRVYTTRLAAGYLTDGGSAAFVAPDGYVCVLRDVSVVAAEAGFTWSLNVDGIYAIELQGGAPGEGTGNHWEGRVACEAGQTITMQGSGGVIYYTVTGWLLSI